MRHLQKDKDWPHEKWTFIIKMTIHLLPHLKCIGLISARSTHLPFKIHEVRFRAFKSLLSCVRANRSDLYKIQYILCWVIKSFSFEGFTNVGQLWRRIEQNQSVLRTPFLSDSVPFSTR